MEPFPSLADLSDAVRSGAEPAERWVSVALDRLEGPGRSLGAVLSLDRERSLAEAATVAARLLAGEQLPLAGVPVAIKDNICTADRPTTCGSRILEHYVPPRDATVVERLRRAGAVIVAKTNMDEFAMGSSNENSAFGPVRNPWDPTRTPGGSSGGSAAAVAAGLVPAALGSDTGGSIRQPAAFTGITGLKPTYGRVSRSGLVAFGSSLDQVGPLTRTVEDAARLLAVISGRDERDATCSARPVPDYLEGIDAGVRGLRIGLPQEYMDERVDPRITTLVRQAAARIEAAGATLTEVSLPHTRYAIPTYYIVATSEASSNLARYDGVHYGRRAEGVDDILSLYLRDRGEGLGAEVVRRIMLGTFCLSSGYYEAFYDRAMRVRTLLRRDFEQAFGHVDVLLSPTTPSPAFRLGEKTADPLQMYLADILTAAGNLAGVPGLVIPCGFVDEGGGPLPVGLQITGPMFSEPALFRAGKAIESALGVAGRLPAGGAA